MRRIGGLSLIFLLTSCDLFLPSENKTMQLAERELQTINWNEVDQLPLFESCDELADKTKQRACFQNTLLKHFANTLAEFEFVLSSEIEEPVYVDFIINKEGSIRVLDIQKNGLIQDQIPEFDGIISRSLKNIPKLEPALKRGIPVDTRFRIPIKMKSQH